MLSYKEIAINSWNAFVSLFEKDIIELKSEADIRSYLFTCCYNNMKNDFPKPLKLFSEFNMENKIPDLVLGEQEIAIEIKYLREGASQTFEDLRADVYKVSEYVRANYVKHSFIAFVDELGSV